MMLSRFKSKSQKSISDCSESKLAALECIPIDAPLSSMTGFFDLADLHKKVLLSVKLPGSVEPIEFPTVLSNRGVFNVPDEDWAWLFMHGLRHCPDLHTLWLHAKSFHIWTLLSRHGLQHTPNLTTLSLEFSRIDAKDMALLCQGLQHCPAISNLELSEMCIGDAALAVLCREGLPHFKSLERLRLDLNKITDEGMRVLCTEGLPHCANLERLDLLDNDYGDEGVIMLAKEGLQHCKKLSSLRLDLKIAEVTTLIVLWEEGLPHVRKLCHAGFMIEDSKIDEIEFVQSFIAHGLPHCPQLGYLAYIKLNKYTSELNIPVEFADKDNHEILSYLREKCENAVVTVSRIKVMLVGPPEAGKTTLVHRLTQDAFSLTQFVMTDGVEMHDWRHGAVDFQLWDFGGQDVYFNSHALFFEARCVYLIVWNPRAVSAHDTVRMLDEYFAHVLNRGPGAPILLVSTRADEVATLLPAVLQAVQQKYPSVVGHVHIDSRSGAAVDVLQAKLVEVALSQPHVTDDIPAKYVKVEKKLRELRNGGARFSISESEYLTEVNNARLDAIHAALLLDLLHKWGAVHVLPGGDIVLQPQDLADVMKCVISSTAQVADSPVSPTNKAGILHHADIGQVWSAYESHLHAQFLALLHSCELAFPLFDSLGAPLAQSLVPAMLPATHQTPEEITLLCYPDFTTESHLFAKVSLTFNVRSTTLFPKLQARLRAMATLGGAWRQAYFVTLDDTLFDEQSSALLLCDPASGNLQIVYRVGYDAACSATLRSLRELMGASFKSMSVTGLKFDVCGQSIERNVILARLKKNRNASYQYVDHDGEDCSVSIAMLRVCLKELDNTPVEIVTDPSYTLPQDFAALSVLLARVNEVNATASDVADLSLELMRSVPHVVRHCGVSARWVQVIWLAVPVVGDATGLHRLVPVSPGCSATDPWEVVHGVSIDLEKTQGINVSLLSTLIGDCLFELGVPRLSGRLVDLSAHQDTLRQLQTAHFEKKTIAEGVEVCIQVKAAVHTMNALPMIVNKVETKMDALHSVLMDAVFDVHRMPLLLSITQPAATSFSGYFARMLQNVYRLHFMCSVCGQQARSGDKGRGYKLSVAKKEVVMVATGLKYTLQALEAISLATPVPLPHLSQLAKYLPSESVLAQWGLDQLHSEAQRRIDADQQLKDVNLSAEGIRAASQQGSVGAAQKAGAVEVCLKDVYLIKDLVKLVGEDVPPRCSGLQPVFFQQAQCAWVCDEEVCEGVHGQHRNCAARFRSEGVACLNIKAAKI